MITCMHVIHSLEFGGAQKDLFYYAKFHDRERYRLEAVSFYPGGEMIPALEELGIKVHVLGTKTSDLGSVARLRRIFRSAGADIVHFHSFLPVFAGVPAAELARVPVKVVTEHSIYTEKAGGLFSDFIYSRLRRRLHMVIACSEQVRRSHSDDIAPERIVTILNGVDLDHFDTRDRGEKAGVYHIGTVGSLTEAKAYHDLISAAARLARLDVPVRLTFVGDGPLRKELEVKAATDGISDNTTFAGKTADVMGHLPGFDVFAGSSIREGLPLAVLEAMAASRPVVTTDVGGNREAVVDGETGLLVPPGDHYALADALETLYRDPDKRASMGRAGRARAERHFSARKMVSETEKLYDSLLERNR
jgi:glycosyltransferase involved in cell wall biosynthesis